MDLVQCPLSLRNGSIQRMLIMESPTTLHCQNPKYPKIYAKWISNILMRLCMHHFQGTYVEGIKEEVVLSPGHALSFIAAGEGI